MGFKNPRSIGNAWSLIKRKIHTINEDGGESKGLPADNEDEAEAAGPATKRARTAKGKGLGAAKAAPTKRARKGRTLLLADEDDDEGSVKTPVKARKVATPRIRVKKSAAVVGSEALAADESHGDAAVDNKAAESEADGII